MIPNLWLAAKKLFSQAERLSLTLILLPWLPSPAMLMRAWVTKQIYNIIVRAMKVRKQSSIPQNDALQMLLDSGEEHFTIIGVTILFLKLMQLLTPICITSL